MKKALYLTAAILAFAGCAKEPAATSVNGIPEGKTVSIVASLDGLKSTFNKTDGFAWRSGENISVGTGDGQYVDFSCTDTENGVFTHTFAGPRTARSRQPRPERHVHFCGELSGHAALVLHLRPPHDQRPADRYAR